MISVGFNAVIMVVLILTVLAAEVGEGELFLEWQRNSVLRIGSVECDKCFEDVVLDQVAALCLPGMACGVAHEELGKDVWAANAGDDLLL